MVKRYLLAILVFVVVAAIGTTIPLVLASGGLAGSLGAMLARELFTFLLVCIFAIPVALLWILGSSMSLRMGWHRPYYVDIALGLAAGLLVYFLALHGPEVGTAQTILAAASFGFGFTAAAIAYWGMART